MLYTGAQREQILARLSGYRLKHTLGCEKAARKLASKYGADSEKCAFAAILHDITKQFSHEQQLNLCKQYGIIPSSVEQIEWKMLHGKTAAAIARAEYHAPEDVCDAIAYHTTGRANMTLIDKIIYLADYIEETRDFEGVKTARKLAHSNLDKALLYCFDSSLRDLLRRKKLIHLDTIAARNSELELLQQLR